MIAIIDYGMGNIHSVQKALEFMGAQTLVTNEPQVLKNCQKIVLPGVGAFDDAMIELKERGLIDALKENIQQGKIFLGICLGMQLLFEKSQEARKCSGLGILKGRVLRFDPSTSSGLSLKVPHMGWNQLKISAKGGFASGEKNVVCPILKDLPDNSYVYFCHSYYPQPKDKEVIAATCDYGIDFTAVVWQDNIYGMQFHPEKSQDVGLKILKNFVNL